MSRNKLVCALSKAIIVIESGPEQDKDGKRSGTFDAGKTALEMKIPLFVLSPRSLKKPPPGNKQLIRLGGIEIDPKDGITAVLEHLSSQNVEQQKPLATEEQISLF
jgi:predicted Rossmann fold nucleotide-binding protein DprA/Smf involved in DNA uptake